MTLTNSHRQQFLLTHERIASHEQMTSTNTKSFLIAIAAKSS